MRCIIGHRVPIFRPIDNIWRCTLTIPPSVQRPPPIPPHPPPPAIPSSIPTDLIDQEYSHLSPFLPSPICPSTRPLLPCSHDAAQLLRSAPPPPPPPPSFTPPFRQSPSKRKKRAAETRLQLLVCHPAHMASCCPAVRHRKVFLSATSTRLVTASSGGSRSGTLTSFIYPSDTALRIYVWQLWPGGFFFFWISQHDWLCLTWFLPKVAF